MLQQLKKIICLLLTAVLALLVFAPSAVSAASAKQSTQEKSIESILYDFHTKSQLAQNSKNTTYSITENNGDKIRQETVETLQDAGYEAYNVTKDNFEQVEEILATDLHAIGLDENSSYIIVLSGEHPDGVSTRDAYDGTPGSAFTYKYNGTTYALRYMTVTAADIPAYGEASDVDLLASSSQTVINNCLNTAISAYISSVSAPFGTVASILGLDISNFAPAKQATLRLNAATNWTRIFTQVLDPSDSSWIYGSCVESALASCFISGYYYKASTNQYTKISSDEKKTIKYSEHYFDLTWRKETAIESIFSITTYDTVGPVKYTYGGSVKITHSLNYY